MYRILIVGLGGFLGAISRYLLSGCVHRVTGSTTFPWGTLCVNIAGCFILGFLGGLVDNREALTPEVRAFVFIGILGAFTTFSTFSYETLALFRDGQMLAGFINVGLSVLLGLGSVFVGYKLSDIF